ncbi:hypothetical protein GL325_05975 [Aeromicrobium sp. 636]|uniref:Tetratricopeptide repeat protein n=1 Tax=Aeromicrobium senzhongii TaxID=2663859 RepID=A0A8I0JZD2_9ACTN|nr:MULTISPECIES: hypothetical protein [Aeromicrobium]MBC9225862.1 hypothetical protein [Aeromicrobium senzhongii]MCQ3997969.1 hypothetical protein [Aeromicrobium sp. 636]
MHDLLMTRPLIAALEDAGVDPTSTETPVAVIAAYLDLLAKEYGLTESQALDTDPIGRVQQPEPVMAVVRHYLAPGSAGLDDGSVRALLYDVFVELAGDPEARRTVNRSNSLTEDRFLHMVQIYWNLEGSNARPRLPIEPSGGRDIPVPGSELDFATMRWTPRTNQKGTYKSSGQSFRNQGACVAVLAAQNLVGDSTPAPGASLGALVVTSTSNPEAPLEVKLKDLVKSAQAEGQHDIAVQTASSYLSIIQQRAAVNPVEYEPDLAEAYVLRGGARLELQIDRALRGHRADFRDRDDIEAAIRSYSTLVDLETDNVDHRVNLADAYMNLSLWHKAADDAEWESTARQALAVAETMPAEHPQRLEAELKVHSAFARLSEGEDAVKAADRMETVLAQIEATDPSERAVTQVEISAAHCLIRDTRHGAAAAVDRRAQAVAAAEQAVAAGDDQSVLLGPLVDLATALFGAERRPEAAAAAERALSLATPDYVRAHPQFAVEHAWTMAWFGKDSGGRRVAEAHADLLDAASEADPENMRRIVTLMLALVEVAHQRLDAGDDAEDWALRAVAAARRLRPSEIPDDVKSMAWEVLRRVLMALWKQSGEQAEASFRWAKEVETIVRLLKEIDPSSDEPMGEGA